jgi:hypothetical protein
MYRYTELKSINSSRIPRVDRGQTDLNFTNFIEYQHLQNQICIIHDRSNNANLESYIMVFFLYKFGQPYFGWREQY